MATVSGAWRFHWVGVMPSHTWASLHQFGRSLIAGLTGISVGANPGVGGRGREPRAMGAGRRRSGDWRASGVELGGLDQPQPGSGLAAR